MGVLSPVCCALDVHQASVTAGLQGRYDEAREWFAQARAVLDEQGARPLRAITEGIERASHPLARRRPPAVPSPRDDGVDTAGRRAQVATGFLTLIALRRDGRGGARVSFSPQAGGFHGDEKSSRRLLPQDRLRHIEQLPPRLGVAGSTMKTLMIGLGTLMLVALTRPALAQRCLSFRAPAFFAGAAVAPGYPYPAFGYPVYPYYPYPLPPAPSLGFGRGGIYGHVFVGRDETVTSYTFPGRDSWQ